jgi:hypothetical protein
MSPPADVVSMLGPQRETSSTASQMTLIASDVIVSRTTSGWISGRRFPTTAEGSCEIVVISHTSFLP